MNNLEKIRKNKITTFKEKGIDSYSSFYLKRNDIKKIRDSFVDLTKEKLEVKNIIKTISGRIIAKRGQGKVYFLNIKSFSGKIQIYVKKTLLNEKEFFIIESSDLGDIISVEGIVMKTMKGELTIKASKIILLTKSVLPLPDKFHGLKDVEQRYRQRYLDLLSNNEVIITFKNRIKIVRLIRDILDQKGFYEFETPVLQEIYGGAAAKPFVTTHNTLKRNYYLRIATELPLKKIIVGGFEKVYEIGRLFRNEGISYKHNPEFTSIEFYEAYSNIEKSMDLTQKLIQKVCLLTRKKLKFKYCNIDINLENNAWEKISMIDAIKKHVNIEISYDSDLQYCLNICKKHNIKIEKHQNEVGHIINLLFETFVEKHLINPTFITDYPEVISPFAKKLKDKEGLTRRFELFIAGTEYANGFDELTDPYDQEQRFLQQEKESKLGNTEISGFDKDYVEALKYGLPPCSGVGIGIDRLIMLACDAKSIKDVIIFPQLRSNKINE